MAQKCMSILLCTVILFTSCWVNSFAAESAGEDLDAILASYQTKQGLSVWEMFVLKRNGLQVPKDQLSSLAGAYQNAQGQMRLVTEYTKIALLMRAEGLSEDLFGSYPVLAQLYQHDNLGKQGVNGYIFSLLALTNEPIPANSKQSTDTIIRSLLTYQMPDGGFSLTKDGKYSDVDLTAMAITALSDYQEDAAVKKALEAAILYLQQNQQEDGNYIYSGDKTSESVSQVIIALTSMGISLEDSRFVKNGKTLLDVLKTYQTDGAHFAHKVGDKANAMATEQAALALTAYELSKRGEKLYELPVIPLANSLTFSDVKKSDWFYPAVNFAVKKNITSGVGEGNFGPNVVVTRGQFIKMACDAYGILPVNEGENFADAGQTWYTPYLAAVKQKGISSGVGNNCFAPQVPVTREQMFVLLYQINLSLQLTDGETPEVGLLNTFKDAAAVSSWAKEPLAYFVQQGVVKGNDGAIDPQSGATRAQMAQIFYALLS